MPSSVRILRHSAVAKTGSFEVRVDGRPPRFFYFDDEGSRRMRPDQMTSDQALDQAKAYAREARDKFFPPAGRSKP